MSQSILRHYVALGASTAAAKSLLQDEQTTLDHARGLRREMAELEAIGRTAVRYNALDPICALAEMNGLMAFIHDPTTEPSVEGLLSGLKELITKTRAAAAKPSHRIQEMDLKGAIAAAKQTDQAFHELMSQLSHDFPKKYKYKPEMVNETIENGVPLNPLLDALRSFTTMTGLIEKVMARPAPHTALEFDAYVKGVRTDLMPLKAVWGEGIDDEGLLDQSGPDILKAKRTTGSVSALGFNTPAAFGRFFTAMKGAALVSAAGILARTDAKFTELRKLHAEQNKVGGNKEARETLERYAESIYAIGLVMTLGYLDHRYTIANIFLQLLNAMYDYKE